ncbi:MAG: hypothetical protein CMH90_04625 [Oceanicaulis sp.]|nr:hypothetical protein [Oceanicaulis sp.]HCR64887.1 hypothetical protein [Oceanicaulis sp.]
MLDRVCGFSATEARLTECGKPGHGKVHAAHLQHVQEMIMTRSSQVQHETGMTVATAAIMASCVTSTALTTTITTITTTLTRGRDGTG